MDRKRLWDVSARRLSRPGLWIAALSGIGIALLGLRVPVSDPAERRAAAEFLLAAALAWLPWLFLAPLAWVSERPGKLASVPKASLRLLGGAVLVAPWVSYFAMRTAYGTLDHYWDHVLGLTLVSALLGLTLGRILAAGDALLEQARASARKAEELDRAVRPFAPEHLWGVLTGFSERAEREPRAVEQDLLALADGYRSWLERTRWLEGSAERASRPAAPRHPFRQLLLRVPRRLAQTWVILTASGLFLAFQSVFLLEGPAKGLAWDGILILEARFLFTLAWLFAIAPLPWQVGLQAEGSFPQWPLGLVLAPLATALRLAILRMLGAPSATPGLFLAEALLDGFAGFWIARREARHDEVREAGRRYSEAYARLLRAQLEPHALLNALNDLAELLREDPARAAQGLGDLAGFHRQLQQLAGLTRITLGEERAFLHRFLAVASIRLERALTVDWQWDERLDALPVPPLLVQPLVENALKHGIAGREAGGILRIVGLWHEHGAEIRVENTGSPTAPPRQGTGVGLANLRARLAFVYHGQARFEFQQDSGWAVARLHLPKEPA